MSVDPSRFSRNGKYISGWIRGYAVSVDTSLSQEMGSIFLGGYAYTRIRGELNPSFLEDGCVFLAFMRTEKRR